MEAFFVYILKVNLLLALFYLVYKLALSNETFYQYSRWFLLSGLFISLLLPFVTFTKIEYYEVQEAVVSGIVSGTTTGTNEVVQERLVSPQEITFYVYGIICVGFLFKTIFDLFKLFRIIQFSYSEKKNKLIYINTNLVRIPFSFFNYIVFNKELINPVELQNIMKHEEAHSLQKHSFDTLLAQFFIILFWFNPLVWMYRKSIVQNLEFLADSYAIQQVSDRAIYQKTMLKLSTQSSKITIINTFNQSSIKKRIIMLNTNQSKKKNALKYVIVIPVLVAFMLLFQVQVVAKERQLDQDITNKKKVLNNSESVVYVINAYSTDQELEEIFQNLRENYSLEAKYYGVKRNNNNEIIAIKVKIKKNKNVSAIHEVEGDTSIDEFVIRVNSKDHTFEIVNSEAIDEAVVEAAVAEEVVIDENFEANTQKEIENAKIEIENAKIEIENAKIEIENAKPEMERAKIEIARAKKEVERAKIEIERAKNEIERAKIEVKNGKNNATRNLESDTAPEPENGIVEFRKYIAKNFKLPEVEKDVNANVVAKFIVSKTGRITDISIISENPKKLGLGDELIRILKDSPKWKPGTKDGKAADLYYVLPVMVQISKSN